MKEYKLRGWPELPAAYHRTTYRRMLSDLSQRYLTVAQLMSTSSASRSEVRSLLALLADHGLLAERDVELPRGSAFGRWLRRTLHRQPAEA